MAINEQIIIGRKFRKLIDESTGLWQRISFWTKASDVEFNDGKNAEEKISDMKSTFQDGVDKIYNACVSAGSTPENKTPDGIKQCIEDGLGTKDIYDKLVEMGITPESKRPSDIVDAITNHLYSSANLHIAYNGGGSYTTTCKSIISANYRAVVTNHDNSFEDTFDAWINVGGNRNGYDKVEVSSFGGGSMAGSWSGIVNAGTHISFTINTSNDNSIHWTQSTSLMVVAME